MASRRSASDQVEQPAATMSSLPEATLWGVLGSLELKDRHGSAALVCRRWRDAINSPLLLRRLDVYIENGNCFLPRLRSLAEWLPTRAAPHMHQLRLRCGEDMDFDDDLPDGEAVEAHSLLAAMLAGCGSLGSQLHELELHAGRFPLTISSWLAPLGRTLQKLTVGTLHETVTITSLPPLPALRELALTVHEDGSVLAEMFQLHPAARLTRALTKLVLQGVKIDDFLPKVGTLSNLGTLVLDGCDLTSDGYAPLARLSSKLRRLELLRFNHLPACLGELTSLEVLRMQTCIAGGDQGNDRVLKAALPQLTTLTCLLLGSMHSVQCPPAELAGLCCLRRFAWYGDARYDAVLPAGAWLAGLQQLAGPAGLLARACHSWQRLGSWRSWGSAM